MKQSLKHLSKQDYLVLRELSHIAKNLTNEAIYNVRQYYFNENQYLKYEKNYVLLKSSENYKMLNSNMAQQILKEVDGCFKSFFALLKMVKKGSIKRFQVSIPHYMPKDGFATLVIGMVRLNGNQLILPFSRSYAKNHEPVCITVPHILEGHKIKEIRIIPKYDARFFEIQYIYEVQEEQHDYMLDPGKALSIDFGVFNLMTAVDTDGHTFIIDGKRLKSINQGWNKQVAKLRSRYDKQWKTEDYPCTKRMAKLHMKRKNLVNDYLSKAARMVINYCLEHQVGVLIVGYNTTFQADPDMGSKNNQMFKNIPFGRLREKLEYLCEEYGILFVQQEESYTSKASFFDNDVIPVYNADHPVNPVFSGKRVKRGLYRTKSGKILNADVNGALNIMRKSSAVPCDVITRLCSRGEVDTPVRKRVV